MKTKFLGWAIYNTKTKKFLKHNGRFGEIPDEFYTIRNCLKNCEGLKNCVPKEVFYNWEE